MNEARQGDIVIYRAPGGKAELQVKLERETVWLSLDQMAGLFDRDKSVISQHLQNVFNSKELNRRLVVAKNATTAAYGKNSEDAVIGDRSLAIRRRPSSSSSRTPSTLTP